MSAWHVFFSDVAERDFSRLDRPIRMQVSERITWLSENMDHAAPVQLHHGLKEFFKLRAGDWRIMYTFEPDTRIIRVREIKHRSKAYKNKG